jgi:hypothetical protein
MHLVTYFEKFVSNIQPTEDRVKAASEAHNDLRDHLTGEDAELKHPVADSFLAGSYGRSTAVDPIKDVDIILILKETEISADRKTPSPRAVLKDLKAGIDRFYDKVELETQRRSIQVYLEEDDLRMDVVPAIAPNGKSKKLWVPDREQNRWIESNPHGHIDYAIKVNAASDGHFVRAAKAMKWWKSRTFEKEMAPKSFLIETIVAHNIATKASDLCQAFEDTLNNILKAYRADHGMRRVPFVEDPGLPGTDLAKSCDWNWEQFNLFFEGIESLHSTAVMANSASASKEKTIELWRTVFGDVYPSSVDTEEEKRIAVSTAPARPGLRFNAKVSAQLSREKEGQLVEPYPSNGRRLGKDWWIRFQLDSTDVPKPYDVRWQVINHGAEAREKGDLRHTTAQGDTIQWERTAYRGRHFMECEIIKNGNVVAKSRYKVNIK